MNKGGIYYTALAPRAARSVPGILFIGEKDLWSRNDTIAGLFAVNRRAGALWALAQEPGAAHIVGRSRDVAMVFFEDVLALRLSGERGASPPRALTEKDGFLGDIGARTFGAAVGGGGTGPTAWLPTERVGAGVAGDGDRAAIPAVTAAAAGVRWGASQASPGRTLAAGLAHAREPDPLLASIGAPFRSPLAARA